MNRTVTVTAIEVKLHHGWGKLQLAMASPRRLCQRRRDRQQIVRRPHAESALHQRPRPRGVQLVGDDQIDAALLQQAGAGPNERSLLAGVAERRVGCIPSVRPFSHRAHSAALLPAISPWHAASSSPLVPLICPARNSPSYFFTFKVRSSSVGSIASYSIAYPGLSISAFSKPGIDFTIAACTSIGRLVDMPLMYTSCVFSPSGSRKNWCFVLSGNRTILSSIDGQYRGPTPEICPVYIGDRCAFSRISRR